MIIKIKPIGSKHGAGVINYAMNKEKAQLVKMQFLDGTSFGIPPDHNSVYEQMRLQQETSKKKCKKPFFRIEVCPPTEKTKDWTLENWQNFCDEALEKLAKQKIDLRNTQIICLLHLDSGKPHLHIIANRIDMNGRIINDWQCQNRGRSAADSIARNHGWMIASQIRDAKNPDIKTIIRQDAMNVLDGMEVFDIRNFFDAMRERGYIINDKWSSEGKCVGYSIGKNEEEMFKSSSLAGRDLVPSRIGDTWHKLHNPEPLSELANAHEQENLQEMVPHEYTTDDGYYSSISIPKDLEDVLNDEIKVPCEIFDDNDLSRDEEWEDELADREMVMTQAIKAFMALAVPSDMGSTSGGGGGVQGELSRWDGLPAERKDEYIDWARRAARDASTACEPKKKKKAHANRR